MIPVNSGINGIVERADDSSRTEFWNLYGGELTVKDAGLALAEYQRLYNHVRPHYAQGLITLMQYPRRYAPEGGSFAPVRVADFTRNRQQTSAVYAVC